MINNPNRFRDYLELSKIKIMIPVSLTGFTGFFAFDPHFSIRIFTVSLGILLMAISASVLNQIQEIDPDSRMDRTKSRPLPAKRISTGNAVIFFLVTLAAGSLIVYFAGNLKAVLIGLIAIFWYNVVYTYLKKVTSFAVVPGAITGALPPLMGWVAAGGGMFDKPIVFIQFLIFVGQIPHFWLLVLKYGDEYRKAGFPNLKDIFSRDQINRLTFSWVIASVFAALFLCSFEIIRNKSIIVLLLVASAYLVWKFSKLLKTTESNTGKNYPVLLDIYFLLILLFLIADKIIS
jgi:heme o synthase